MGQIPAIFPGASVRHRVLVGLILGLFHVAIPESWAEVSRTGKITAWFFVYILSLNNSAS